MDDYQQQQQLPATKIKRQYKCNVCAHSTVNPRVHLRHLNEVHDQKVKIVECPHCVYACQYKQKLNRHLRLVHNSKPHYNQQGQQQYRYHYQQHQQHQQYQHQEQQEQQQQQQQQHQQQEIFYQQDEPIDLSFPPQTKLLIRILGPWWEAQLRAAQPYNHQVTTQQVPHLADLQIPGYPSSQFGYTWNYD